MNDFRKDRFTWNPGDHVEITFPEDVLKEELNKNLSAMKNQNLSNKQFVQLSERNIEIQNELIRLKQ